MILRVFHLNLYNDNILNVKTENFVCLFFVKILCMLISNLMPATFKKLN